MTLAGDFNNSEEYLDALNVVPKIHLIKKPFFFISSMDDPFFGPEIVPVNHSADHVLLGVTQPGAHCCWIEGNILPFKLWWSKPAIEFIEYFN
jgi:predicted alpha/beta-fold hydrolase